MESINTLTHNNPHLWEGDKRENVCFRDAIRVDSPIDQNIQWTLRESQCFALQYSKIHRLGLFTKVYIPKGAMVIEYVGERLGFSHAVLRHDIKYKNLSDSYMLRVDSNEVIDATYQGNAAKFVNHSCSPNVEAQIFEYLIRETPGERVYRNSVWFVAKKDINEDEEILLDYKYSRDEFDPIPKCYCYTKACRKVPHYMFEDITGHQLNDE